jgi:hypothetical protein
MRILPDKTIKNSTELLAKNKAKTERITHKAALVFVFLIVLFLFLKMLLP